jgi:hypothetical protein
VVSEVSIKCPQIYGREMGRVRKGDWLPKF